MASSVIPKEIRPNSIAYFSMEVGIDSGMPTYSGGLGVLAGDTLRAAADLGLPMIGVTLLHRKGYFRQTLDANGIQTERPVAWAYEEILEPIVPRAFVPIAGRAVGIRAWRYVVRGVFGHTVPVYFLDTGIKENAPWEQSLTEALYDGDARHRLCQEIVLGMGGVAMLQALGYKNVSTHHMNEGHAAFLTLALLEQEVARGDLTAVADSDGEAESLYNKLEHAILPLYYGKPGAYAAIRRSAISLNGSYFHSQRMVLQYVRNSYLGIEP